MQNNVSPHSLNTIEDRITTLKYLFPEAVHEGRLDYDTFMTLIGNSFDTDTEKYRFEWKGKQASLQLAQKPSTATLRPILHESRNWNTTNNLYIEGDNLEVMKLLQRAYLGKIKMIYIDPPYNTGNDFVYKDNFKEPLEGYKEATEQVNRANPEKAGRYHSNWLSMMYPRLIVARTLLRDDGVLFISIDDNEQANLKKLCDEVFGEENCITNFIWEKTQHFGRQKLNYYSNCESVLCYAKQLQDSNGLKSLLVERILHDFDDAPLYNKSNPSKTLILPKEHVIFKIPDGIYQTSTDAEKYQLLEPVEIVDGTSKHDIKIHFRSRWTNQTLEREVSKGAKIVIKSDKFSPRIIYSENKISTVAPKQIIFTNRNNALCARYNNSVVGTSSDGTSEVSSLLGDDIFVYPKPISLISYIITISQVKDNDIILDFFSGSATTAHAVMQLNAEDGGKRRFIMVQLPEAIDENSKAYSAGYKTITDIGKERIRRAGEKIIQEYPEQAESVDTGFKVFKLDSSNLIKWDSDFSNVTKEEQVKEIQYRMEHVAEVKPDRKEIDLIYEVMIKYGLLLTEPIAEYTIQKKKFYAIKAEQYLFVCLDRGITRDVIEECIQRYTMRTMIFADCCFTNNNDIINIEDVLNKAKIEFMWI